MQNTGKPNNSRPRKKKDSDETATLIIPQITPEVIARAREAMARGMSAEEAAKMATAEAAEAAAAKFRAASTPSESTSEIKKPTKVEAKSETQSEDAVSVQPRKRSGSHPGVTVRVRPQEGPSTDDIPEIDSTRTVEMTSTVDATSTVETTATIGATSATGTVKPATKSKNRVRKSAKQPSAKAGPRSLRQAETDLFKSIHDDHLWLNNPMMVRGLGLAPAVVAASDCDNALMLCVAALFLITLTRVLAVAICHLTNNRHRPLIYVYSAALVYIPTYVLLFELFGSSLTALSIYLPLLAVEPVVIKRVETNSLETVTEALHRGINNSLGYCIALMLVGIVREFLATGSFFGNKVVSFSLLPLAAQPAGGFILIGVICAVWTAIGGAYVHYKREEVRHLYADADK